MTEPRHPRAGKRAGEVDWDHVNTTTLLRLHGALIMGIVDPVLVPSPMSEEEGAWVREHAWTEGIRKIENAYPHGFYRWCSCQRGSCWRCLNGHCGTCLHRDGLPRVDDNAGTITDRDGYVRAVITHLPGQRPCRWICKCTHVGAPTDSPIAAENVPPVPERHRPCKAAPGQGALFELQAFPEVTL